MWSGHVADLEGLQFATDGVRDALQHAELPLRVLDHRCKARVAGRQQAGIEQLLRPVAVPVRIARAVLAIADRIGHEEELRPGIDELFPGHHVEDAPAILVRLTHQAIGLGQSRVLERRRHFRHAEPGEVVIEREPVALGLLVTDSSRGREAEKRDAVSPGSSTHHPENLEQRRVFRGFSCILGISAMETTTRGRPLKTGARGCH